VHARRDPAIYDDIGVTYGTTRREDPRLLRVILDALGDVGSVANVGAGTGSYEPRDRRVVAVEPSVRMIRQRPEGTAPVVRAAAEALPLASGAVEAALAVLTVHHWSNQGAGLAELCRVARDRVVVFTWDPGSSGFWLTRDYFPQFLREDRRRFPAIGSILGCLTEATVTAVPIPHDCEDGFMGAFWQRPAAYLDAGIRRGISRFQLCEDLSPLEGLKRDLASGAWEARYGGMLQAREWDLGYRLIVGRPREQGA
jgi:SAM-dependent methyltransferase